MSLITILSDAITAAVHLSSRYLSGRQLPDKAISVLDTACARVALQQSGTPERMTLIESQLADLEGQERLLERDEDLGADHAARILAIVEDIERLRLELRDSSDRWKCEMDIVSQVLALQTQIRDTDRTSLQHASLTKQLQTKLDELTRVQGDAPTVAAFVDAQVVGQVISGWTGIPAGRMLKQEVSSVLDLEKRLAKRILGQDKALKIISRRMITAKAKVGDPAGPFGIFLLVGPSGVGKTETALALAEEFYGGSRNLISVNMTEFKEGHSASLLKGAPPGYKGYKEGGVLTEAVRRQPYSVILLDEIEKAHGDVRELFFQIFATGRLDDSEGREIDFRNTVILLTTNACSHLLLARARGAHPADAGDSTVEMLKPELDRIFGDAFLGRLVVVPYYPLSDTTLQKIIVQKLAATQKRVLDFHHVRLVYDESVVSEVLARCKEVESGARNVDAILTNTLLPDISRYLLEMFAKDRAPEDLRIKVGKGGFQYEEMRAAGSVPRKLELDSAAARNKTLGEENSG